MSNAERIIAAALALPVVEQELEKLNAQPLMGDNVVARERRQAINQQRKTLEDRRDLLLFVICESNLR